MQKRKYTHMKAAEGIILSMRQDGMTFQEIAAKSQGRPRKDGQPPKQDIEKELHRLRMENKLLRDFLQCEA